MTLKELMTKDVVTALPSTPVQEIIGLLCKRHISGIPVVNEKKDVLGMITESDLLYRVKLPGMKILLDQEALYCDPKPIIHKYRKIGGHTAGQIMTSNPVTAPEDGTVESVVDVMIEKKVSPIPVVRGKKLVGIISRSDVMRHLMEEERAQEKNPPSDREVTEQVTQVLNKCICFPVRNLTVQTQKGKVYLSGEIDSKDNLEYVEDVVRSIRGVREVESDLLVANLFM